MFEARYYVHLFHHREERRVWHVADRQARSTKFVSKTFFNEKSARILCDRMNADWQKYMFHRIAERHS